MAGDGMAVPFRSSEALKQRLEQYRACLHRRRIFLTLLTLVFLLAAGIFTRLAAVGLPQPWVDRICEFASTDALSVELDRVSFSVATLRLRIGGVRIYPKGVVSTPIAESHGVNIAFRPRLSAPSGAWIRSIFVDQLSIVSLSVPTAPAAPEAPSTPSTSPESGTGGTGPSSSFTGTLLKDFSPVDFACRSLDVFGLRAREMRGTLLCEQGVLKIKGASLRVDAPREPFQQFLISSFAFNPARCSFEATGAGTLDPNKLCPLLEALDEEDISAEIARLSFPRTAPHVRVSYRYDPGANVRHLAIGLNGQNLKYSGVPLTVCRGLITVSGDGAWQHVRINPIHIERPEGSADGQLDIDTVNRRITFKGDSTIDPSHLFRLIRLVEKEEDAPPLSFDNPSIVTASGVYAYGAEDGWSGTDLSVSVLSPGCNITGEKPARFERLRGSFRLQDNVLETSRIDADLFGGAFSGTAKLIFPLREEAESMQNPWLQFQAEGERVSWSRLAKLFANLEVETEGRTFFTFRSEGPFQDLISGELAETEGEYKLKIRAGHIFRLPLFMGLTDHLANVIPGVNFLVNLDDLQTEGRIYRRRINLDQFRISGSSFGLTGQGAIWTDDEVDLRVKLHLLNKKTLIGRAFYYLQWPISSALGVRATGPLSSPVWSSSVLWGKPSRRDLEEAAEEKAAADRANP